MERTIRRVACGLALSLMGLSAHAQSLPDQPPVWELKGLTLGMSIAELTTALPSVKCETEAFDSGLTTCTDWNNTLAGAKAVVTVKFLEGVAVYVCLDNLNLQQADAAASGLVAKFGAATRIDQVEGQQNARSRERNLWTDASRYSWIAGDVSLQVDPFSWTNSKGTTFSAVILKDEAKHDRQWIVRYNSKGKVASDI